MDGMRERLIELLGLRLPIIAINAMGSYDTVGERTLSHNDREKFADHLLANGVIVPPCKVGETLYFLYDNTFANRPNSTPHIYETKDWYFDIDEKGISILPRSIHSYKGKHHYYLGKTVFITKEEAEKSLKEREKV